MEIINEYIKILGCHAGYGSLVSINLSQGSSPVGLVLQLISQFVQDGKKVIVFDLGNPKVSEGILQELIANLGIKVVDESIILNSVFSPYYERMFTEIGNDYNAVILGADTRYCGDEQREQHMKRLNLLIDRFHNDIIVINSSSESDTINDCTIEPECFFSPDRISVIHKELFDHILWGEYSQSIDLAIDLENNGDPKGMYILGLHMKNGWSYPIDRYGAAELFRAALIAAGKDFLEPLIELHKLYSDPEFPDASEELSIHYLVRAACLGDKASMQKLAEYYSSKSYIDEAVYWYRLAGEQFKDGSLLYKAAELLIEYDYDISLAWTKLIPRAAEYGCYEAIKSYGLALAGKKPTDECIDVDLNKAVSVMGTLMDARQYDSAEDVIDDAISAIEILQSQPVK